MTGHAIHMADVGKRYPRVTAVEGVSLAVAQGERIALVGHNGAGKTTLFKLLLGLVAPTSGQLQVLGADPRGSEGARLRGAIGFLPENVAFEDGMTGRETLRFFARLKGVPTGVVESLLARVGLAAAAGRRVRTYSKGMRQRLGLAQALLGQPALLLLDEPTTGLDPILRAGFYDILNELQAVGVTIVLASHVLSELEVRTDRIVILNQGQVAADGTLAEIRAAAGLETALRVRTQPCRTGQVVAALGADFDCTRQDDRTLVVTCPPHRKLEALRGVMALGEVVEDVETLPPSLEEIYRRVARPVASGGEAP